MNHTYCIDFNYWNTVLMLTEVKYVYHFVLAEWFYMLLHAKLNVVGLILGFRIVVVHCKRVLY